jgi:RNA polymerase sigma-70 factor (ECF subfamily)
MLVNACLAGDRNAFAQLVDSYQRQLFNATYRVTGSWDDAMDATQTAFIKAYEKLHTYDTGHRFFSWIYRIALNEALNLLGRRRSVSLVDVSAPATDPDPEQAYQEAETSRRVQEALMQLASRHRVILVLRHFHGLSYREIAEVVGIPEKTVKSRLFTARQRLRTVLLDRGVEP